MEKATVTSERSLTALSSGHRAVIGAAKLGALLIAGWFGSGLLTPSMEIGAADGTAPGVSIKNCDASWLNQKVDALSKRCHLGNIERLGPAESAMYEQYEAVQLEYRVAVEHKSIEDQEVRRSIHALSWPEEDAVRRQIATLSGSNELRSLAFAERLHLGRMQQLSTYIAGLRRSVDTAKVKTQARPAAQDTPASPYSITPAADSSDFTVPIVGKSGPFNIYAIEPKDDLDALHYFVGSSRFEPHVLADMLPVIEKATAEQHGLKCEFLCADAQGNIVGRTRIHADGPGAK